MFAAISGSLAAHVSSWHSVLKVYEPSMISIAPFVSTGTALVITPLVSLVTRQDNSETKGIWKHFQAGEEEKGEAFHLIPISVVGRVGVALMVLGMLGFLFGVISASRAFPLATSLAVGGMIMVFVGGLLRVYSE